MKYFTPQLYAESNDLDDSRVMAAMKKWDVGLARYRAHLKRIERHLPPSLREFMSSICLHDAEVIGPVVTRHPMVPGHHEVVFVTCNQMPIDGSPKGQVVFLRYLVVNQPIQDRPLDAKVFATHPHPVLWLYEELDVIKPGLFLQEILLSDGRVVRIEFKDFSYHVATPLPLSNGSAKRRLASTGKTLSNR